MTVYDNKPIATASTTPSAPEAKRSARLFVVSAGVLVAIALAPFTVGGISWKWKSSRHD